MRVVFQKADLDTCLTALICGVDDLDPSELVRGPASAADLADPAVLCIEAGGSGQVDCNNFDHHHPLHYFPPACRQAALRHAVSGSALLRLVDYVCRVDEALPIVPPVGYPSLSNLFSGMRLALPDVHDQFRQGVALLDVVWQHGYDPFITIPVADPWRVFLSASEANRALLAKDVACAKDFYTSKGTRGGFVSSRAAGALGALYQRGSQIAVAFNPESSKYTIGSRDLAVAGLLPVLNRIESGWGGREQIIGSRPGSRVGDQEVLQIISELL